MGNFITVLTYDDDCIIVGNNIKYINSFIDSLKNGPEKFVITEKADINKFICIKITQLNIKLFKLSQPYFIDRIISLIGFNPDKFDIKKFKLSPVSKGLLHKDIKVRPRKEK